MIIWTGHGYLGGLIPLVALAATQFTVDAALGEGFYKANLWPKLLALAAGAAPLWFIGVRLNSGQPRTLVDPQTGEEVHLSPPSHTLMFVPLQYWTFVLLALAAVFGIATAVDAK